jgi:hypothetical protein
MVVLATIDQKDTWIDAGDPYLPLGLLRADALNTKAWVVDEIDPFWIDIQPVDSKSIYLIKGSIDKDGNLNADFESRFTAYHAFLQRMNAENQDEKFGDHLIVSNSNPVTISEIELINTKEISKPFQLKGKIINSTVATVTP